VTGDATYRKHVGRGSSHGHRQHAQKLIKIAFVVPEIGLHALSMEKKTPSRRFAMWPIVNMSEEDRATDTGNMHKNLVKIARVVPGISSRTDRETDHRPTDRHIHHKNVKHEKCDKNNKSLAVDEMGDRLAKIDMGRKVGAVVPLSVGELQVPV